ncbi:MAG: GNAT family N-acetyltransferase [Bacteroidota bacterium]
MVVKPVILEGTHVRLEPMTIGHLDALWEVGNDPDLWQWTTSNISTKELMASYIRSGVRALEEGTGVPFVIQSKADNMVAGSTRFGNIDMENKKLEIGWTWVARRWQRSSVNTECKLLLLQHAFETLGCNRVELKTDALNTRSRAAILRIGAKEEGILRSHMVTATGRVRDSVYYSILAAEWPAVKLALQSKLGSDHVAR